MGVSRAAKTPRSSRQSTRRVYMTSLRCCKATSSSSDDGTPEAARHGIDWSRAGCVGREELLKH